MLLCFYALFIYTFCNALLLCSSGCCMPRAFSGADTGADARCFIVLNMLLCFMLFMLFRNFGIWFHLEEKWYFRSQKPAIYFTVENEGFTLKHLLCRTRFYTEKNVSIQRRRRKNYYILNPYLAYNIEHFPKTLYISGTSLVTKMQNLKLEFRNENTPHCSWVE